MNFNNLRIIYCKNAKRYNQFDAFTIVDYTYDIDTIKNYIFLYKGMDNLAKDYILGDLYSSGYSRMSIEPDEPNTHIIIIDTESKTNNTDYIIYINIFKQLHRDYQLKGIINEL